MAGFLIQAVREALSLPRIETYERAVVVAGDIAPAAIALYDWNAQISGAFMAPLHICEVVMRNAVSDALTALYGDRWPWSPVLLDSLPAPRGVYNPRRDLEYVRGREATTGKVIPELKFSFWVSMFTSRHDVRVWDVHLRRVLPNVDTGKSVAELRLAIYTELDNVRRFRNRIAHHEPIFTRNLVGDFDRIVALIRLRSHDTADWMIQNQWVTSHLQHP